MNKEKMHCAGFLQIGAVQYKFQFFEILHRHGQTGEFLFPLLSSSIIFNNSSADVIITLYYFPFLLIAVKVPMNAIAAAK